MEVLGMRVREIFLARPGVEVWWGHRDMLMEEVRRGSIDGWSERLGMKRYVRVVMRLLVIVISHVIISSRRLIFCDQEVLYTILHFLPSHPVLRLS